MDKNSSRLLVISGGAGARVNAFGFDDSASVSLLCIFDMCASGHADKTSPGKKWDLLENPRNAAPHLVTYPVHLMPTQALF